MITLNEKEQEIFDRKREIINRSIDFYGKLTEDFHQSVDKLLAKLIKNDNADFICDMYIEFLSRCSFMRSSLGGESYRKKKQAFIEGLKDNKNLENIMYSFSRFLVKKVLKFSDGYKSVFFGPKYDLEISNEEDNKKIFELRDFVYALLYLEEETEYEIHYNDALIRLMGYIILHKEYFRNSNTYKELLISLDEHFYNYYEDCLLNYGHMESQLFDVETYMRDYLNGSKVKREIL